MRSAERHKVKDVKREMTDSWGNLGQVIGRWAKR